MNFIHQKEAVNFGDHILFVEVIYDKDMEYLPRVSLRGMCNLHHPNINDWDALMSLAQNWIDKGYWLHWEFHEFCERVFSND